MANMLERNKNVKPVKKTRADYAEDALYREVWEEVNNEKTMRFIKKYYKVILGVAIGIMIIAVGIQIGVRHKAMQKIRTAEQYETAITTMDPAKIAAVADNVDGATADLALFQAYLLDNDIAKIEQLAKDGNTRDFRDLAKLHVIGAKGDAMTAQQVEEYLSDLDTKNSPFYYTAALTVAQKYLSVGDKDTANKWLDKIIKDDKAPVSISGAAQALR